MEDPWERYKTNEKITSRSRRMNTNFPRLDIKFWIAVIIVSVRAKKSVYDEARAKNVKPLHVSSQGLFSSKQRWIGEN